MLRKMLGGSAEERRIAYTRRERSTGLVCANWAAEPCGPAETRERTAVRSCALLSRSKGAHEMCAGVKGRQWLPP